MALVAGLVAAPAAALEPGDEIVRSDLIRRAEIARRAGDHLAAVDQARRASRLGASPSLWYFLAREYRALDRPLDTLAAAGACARGAEADPHLHSRATLLHECSAWVGWAEARVGRVTVRLAAPEPSGASVRIAGNQLDEAELGVPYPVLPGLVRIDAVAPGHEPWHEEVTVVAGGSVDVVIASLRPTPAAPLPQVPPPRVPEVPPTPPPVAAAPPVSLPRPATVADRHEPGAAGPWIVGGAGLASLATAGVLYGLAIGARNDRDSACPPAPGSCDLSAVGDDERYRRYITGTDVALGLGAVALAAGALWWVLARDTHQASLAPIVGRTRLGLAVWW